MKHCHICGRTRPLDDFGLCRAMGDGRQTRCNECRLRYRESHRAELASKERARQVRLGEVLRVKRREYEQAHREQSRARAAQWRREHPERWRDLRRKHKRLRQGMDPETAAFAALLLGDPCSYCGRPAETIDHIVALNEGGANHWSNLTAACFRCNQSKRTNPALLWWARGAWRRWNSWDCGEDAVYSLTTVAATVPEAIAKLVRSCLESRERHGGPNWRPAVKAPA